MPDTQPPVEGLVDDLELEDRPARARPDTLERTNAMPRGPLAPYVAYERDLSVADLEARQLSVAAPPRALMRIHASHHSLARCLATGMKPGQAALVTGYSPGRISALQRDPAFQALCADYRAEAKSIFADLAERMHDISLDAIELLHERIHEKPAELSIAMLLEIVKAFADRTGHGPGQEVTIRAQRDLIDRPPRETYEEWKARREFELAPAPEMKKLN
jgi:hypothetical protein